MKRILLVATALLALNACASQPSQTLDQKLAGQTGETRKETLRLACLNEAEWPQPKAPFLGYKYSYQFSHRYNAEVSEMKALCRQMDEASAQAGPSLAKACKEKTALKQQKHGENAAEHVHRLEDICKAMTAS